MFTKSTSMKNYSKPPYYLHEGACVLNVVIKAINNQSISLLDVSNGAELRSAAMKTNEVANFLKIEQRAYNDIGSMVCVIQLLVEKVLSDGTISEKELEVNIDSELNNFIKTHKS
jgi:hypothetical protein